jgi:hypothetical protein
MQDTFRGQQALANAFRGGSTETEAVSESQESFISQESFMRMRESVRRAPGSIQVFECAQDDETDTPGGRL